MEGIGSAIRERRKQLGLTQQTLALYSGVSAKFIVELESDKPTVRLDKVFQVLDVLGYELKVGPIEQ